MKPESNSIEACAADVAGPRHACAFFDGPEDEYRVLLPFAQQCARCGERLFQFVDPMHKAERLKHLVEGGAGTDVILSGVLGWDESSLRGGRFEADNMIALIRDAVDRSNGAPRARLWGNMEWGMKEEELVDFESRLNVVYDSSDAIAICAYQVGRYSAEVALGVLRAHPWILVGDKLEPNPAYMARA